VFNSAWGKSTVGGRLVGVAQQHFNVTVAKEMRIPHPPIDEQRRIAAVLAAYDELIENNLRRIEILEEIPQAVYREWFVSFRFPGYEGVPLVDSPLGEIPYGWSAGAYGDIALESRSGVDPKNVDPETRYVGLEHIPQRSFTLTEHASSAEVSSRKWMFEPGDILFGKLRPYFHKVAEASFAGIVSTDAIVIRPRPGWRDYALQVAFSKEFVDHAVSTSQGTDRPRAQWSDLAAFKIPLPDQSTNERCAATIRPMVDLAANLATQNTNLRSTRDLLLPRLVSGEIDVSELEIETEWLAS
jgi:type I restriction enzyme S subunit